MTNFNIDVVAACAWIFPTKMEGHNASNQVYRQAELDKIMQFHSNEPARVKEYDEWRNANRLTEDDTEDSVKLVDGASKIAR